MQLEVNIIISQNATFYVSVCKSSSRAMLSYKPNLVQVVNYRGLGVDNLRFDRYPLANMLRASTISQSCCSCFDT